MRLITTSEPWRFLETYKATSYAILSHTWMTTDSGESQEVSYQELQAFMEDPQKQAITAAKPGFEKIKNAIKKASCDGHKHIWIDTCCIDKTNLLELDEAIRCMFKWYQDATICYAYLSDVEKPLNGTPYQEVQSSRWFTRGWTLQELIAPRDVVFLAKDWSYLGNRMSEDRFGEVLCEASGVSEEVLYGTFDTSAISVSERMRWASRRKTTRIEDMAYSLMGIFGVHMPIMYGEGKNAFVRLQKEILRNSDDPSIFAWTSPHEHDDKICGLLADSPEYFSDAKVLRQHDDFLHQKYNEFDVSSDVWQDTNKGIRLRLLLNPCEDDEEDPDVFAKLDCYYIENQVLKRPMLRLRFIGLNEVARVHTGRVFSCTTTDEAGPLAQYKTVFVKQTPLHREPELIIAQEHLSQQSTNSSFGFTLLQVYPEAYWDGRRFHNTKGQSSRPLPAIFRFERTGGSEYYVDVAVGFKNEASGTWSPWHIQRRCKDASERIGRVHRLVCKAMATSAVGPHRPSDGGEGFGQHIDSIVFITASPSSTINQAFTISLESPLVRCSMPLKTIQAYDNSVDASYFVLETSPPTADRNTIKSISEYLAPLVVKWNPLNDFIFNSKLTHVVRVGPRDYSSILQVIKESEYLFSPLHEAALEGRVDSFESLYKTDDFTWYLASGWSACHMAAAKGHGSFVQILMNSFPSLAVHSNSQNVEAGPCNPGRYESIFHIVAGVENITADDYLLSRSFWSLYAGMAETREVKSFLDETPLHRAAAAGNMDVAIILIDLCSSDIEAVDMNGRRPLWHAAAAGHVEIVELLIAGQPKSAQLYRKDSVGINELHIACWNNHPRVVHSLLSHTADPNVPSSRFGFTPAHFAYYADSTDCIKVLETFGADMEARSNPSCASTSPKGMKAFAEKVREYHALDILSCALFKETTTA